MWIDEYVKLMYPKNMEDVQMKEAMRLKYNNIPNSLYKYRAFSKFSIENLENDEAWFNTAAEFNDPYDCALTLENTAIDHMTTKLKTNIFGLIRDLNLNLTKEEVARIDSMGFVEASKYFLSFDKNLKEEEIEARVKATAQNIQNESKKNLQKMNEVLQMKIKICCFSEINDSILMWSHYANNHKGFCIEYDFKKEGVDPKLTRWLQPVIYRDKLFNAGQYFEGERKRVSELNPFIVNYNAIIKSTEWSYEKEWRITYTTNDKEGFNKKLFSPQAIYLGAKMCDIEKERIIEIAKQRQIIVFQMNMKNREFKLVPERVL